MSSIDSGGVPWYSVTRVLLHNTAREPHKEKEKEEVSPAEDLMREHGVLKGALLVYSECANRLESGKEFPPDTVTGTANLIRNFIEDYHEKLEEEYLFPRFRKAGKLVDLVAVLEAQHQAGRRITEQILQSAKSRGMSRDSNTASYARVILTDCVLFALAGSIIDRRRPTNAFPKLSFAELRS
jgi:hypothetical protein